MPPFPPAGSHGRARPLFARRLWGCCLCLAAALPVARAQVSDRQLTELSLEELMQVEVTTVSKHAEKLTAAPAAVFTLSGDDLRRAGVPDLPDALRLVPGVQVGQVDAHNWAISARGFSDLFSTKLLVLRDGRSLYTPLFSGVFWDVQDTLMADIDRIEVVRGPGATLWGANAVNGVIDIISKPASETQGTLVRVAGGTDPEAQGSVRYGGALSPNTHFRVYAKGTRHGRSKLPDGSDAHDSATLSLAGFRLDHADTGGEQLMLEGEIYKGAEDQLYYVPAATPPFVSALPSDVDVDGGHLLARWTRTTANGNEWTAQSYGDYTSRKTAIFDDRRRIYDAEAQGRILAGAHQELTLGAGFRISRDDVRNTNTVSLIPDHEQTNIASAFAQDDVELVPQRLHLVAGTKVEHNPYTGTEVQPSGRLLFTPGERSTFWFSVARAVRTPSRADEGVIVRQVTDLPAVSLTIHGQPSVHSEVLHAYEAGYRFQAHDKVSIDLALFYNNYPDLRSNEFDLGSLYLLSQLQNPATARNIPPPYVLQTYGADLLYGETHGGEVAVNFQPLPGWRLRTTFSVIRVHLHTRPGSTDVSTAALTAGHQPNQQATLWSQHDFGSWRIDWMLRYVDAISAIRVPHYVEGDARIAYRFNATWEAAVVGRNLLHRSHLEYVPSDVISETTRVPRSVFLELRHGY